MYISRAASKRREAQVFQPFLRRIIVINPRQTDWSVISRKPGRALKEMLKEGEEDTWLAIVALHLGSDIPTDARW